jgi:hypothetical protein
VDSKPTFRDDVENLLDPNLASVVSFERAPGLKPAIGDGKDDGFEEVLVLEVKRAVYKNSQRGRLRRRRI